MNDRALLIFDLDGTLYCTESSFLPTMRRVYSEFSVPAPPDDEIMSMVGETFPTFVEWLLPQGFKASREAVIEAIVRYELNAISSEGKLYPGVRKTLAALQDGGHTIALCTNGDAQYAGAVLGTTGIASCFAHLQTLDSDEDSKTGMVAELRQLYPRACAYMIGDRYHDVEAGRANGCTVVGAVYGYGRPGELDSVDYRIARFTELPSIILLAEQELVAKAL